ncbi:penicillin-binding protein 2 [soil metagenome]
MSNLQWAGILWALVLGGTIVFALVHQQRSVAVRRNVPVLSVAMLGMLVVLVVQAARIQVFQQRAVATRAGVDPRTGEVVSNPRASLGDLTSMRGSILDDEQSPLAWTEMMGSHAQRVYGESAVSQVAGFFSPLLYGKDGIEEAEQDVLSRGKARSLEQHLQEAIGARVARPESVKLTINSGLQRAAQGLLGDRVGAAVVIETASGAVKALASVPWVDPAPLAAVEPDDMTRARAYWSSLLDDPDGPLLRRSTLGLYTPGSTFKVVTAAAAIDSGIASPDTMFEDGGVFTIDGHTILEVNRPDDSVSTWSLSEGFIFSLNVVFARIGLELGAERLTAYARAFGFDESVPFDIPVARGQVASSDDFLRSRPALADTGFGQGELLATPLQMALVCSAFCNRGSIMKPRLVSGYLDVNGRHLEVAQSAVWTRPISETTAETMQQMLIRSVQEGYAYGASVPGYTIGGKTGTAETAEDDPHGWFIGFGGDPEPRFAVAVVLEHGGSGGGVPATIGGQLLAEALSSG